jgi:acylpyruvate hydrolase
MRKQDDMCLGIARTVYSYTTMRFVTFSHADGSRAGVIIGDAVATLDYADVGALLRAGEPGLEAAREAVNTGGDRTLADLQLLKPIAAPTVVVCVGHNYRTHILEMGRDLPSAPTLFGKAPIALTDPYADVPLPPDSPSVDYEGELAVVIGTGGRNIAPEAAWDAVAGLTVLNDVSMRDHQRRTIQWFAGKSWEASTPVGPQVVTLDELPDIAALELRVTVNGDERQRALLGDLVFDVPTLVSDISRIFTLRPGDMIATGTPGGVGEARDPATFLRDGDVVEVSISEIGTLRNRFVAA